MTQQDDITQRVLTTEKRNEFIRRTSYISEADRDTRAAFVDEIVRAALASAPVADAPVCQRCGGTGEADSGGIHPWGAPALIPCECTISAPVAGEAVAEVNKLIKCEISFTPHGIKSKLPHGTKLYAAPQARPSDDDLWDQTLKERDHYHDMADRLAKAIGAYFGQDAGEHSSSHCPWHEALGIIGDAAPQASAENVRNVDAAMAAEYQQWIDWYHKGLDYDSFLKECVFNKPQADKPSQRFPMDDGSDSWDGARKRVPKERQADKDGEACAKGDGNV